MSAIANAMDPWVIMPAVITDARQETPGVCTYRIDLTSQDAVERYSAKPGQFNMLYVPGVGEAAISLSGSSGLCQPLIHTIRAVGNVTNHLARQPIGATLGIRGPFGTHWPLEQCLGKDLILVAGGIGLAPLRPVILHIVSMRQHYGKVVLLFGARSPSDLLFANDHALWQQSGIEVETTVDRADQDWKGNIGVVTQLLQRLSIGRPASTVLFTCGPEVMMMYAIREALDREISADSIWMSLERNMNCAIGHCGHCQFGPHFACKDGPVLAYQRVARLLEISGL